MRVRVSHRGRHNRRDRHGWRVALDVATPNTLPATIYQNVHVTVQTVNGSGEKDRLCYRFTEGFAYDGRRPPFDSFLMPVDWRLDQRGSMQVRTTLWATAGPVDPRLRANPDGDDYWGAVPGSFEMLRATGAKTRRDVKITWDNLGVRARKALTGGKDLVLERDQVRYDASRSHHGKKKSKVGV